MLELLGLPYSPWTEKARWALDVRKVPYRYRVYQPLIGELELRLKTRRPLGTVSVPLLSDGRGKVYDDSAKIARFADLHGEGPLLFPPEHESAITRWIELSERGLSALRVLALERQLLDREALTELVPRGLRAKLGRLAPGLAAFGLRRTLRKYGAGVRTLDQHRLVARAVLSEVRAALRDSPSTPKTLLGSFTFADIAVTQVLAFVSPPSFGLKLGRAARRGFTDQMLAQEFADLVAWRDAIYDSYRPRNVK